MREEVGHDEKNRQSGSSDCGSCSNSCCEDQFRGKLAKCRLTRLPMSLMMWFRVSRTTLRRHLEDYADTPKWFGSSDSPRGESCR